MIVELEKYRIIQRDESTTIEVKAKGDNWIATYWYSKPEQAIQKLLDLKLAGKDLVNAAVIIGAIKGAKDELIQAIREAQDDH